MCGPIIDMSIREHYKVFPSEVENGPDEYDVWAVDVYGAPQYVVESGFKTENLAAIHIRSL